MPVSTSQTDGWVVHVDGSMMVQWSALCGCTFSPYFHPIKDV